MTDLGELIQRRRHFVTIVVRSICAVLVVAGVLGAIAVTGRSIMWSGWAGVRAAMGDYSGVGYLSLSAACVAVGLTIAVLNERLVKWLVPVMHPACPSCGYALGKTQSRSCSECGFVLGSKDGRGPSPGEDQGS